MPNYSAMIVARSDRIGEALQVILRTFPQLDRVDNTDNVAQAVAQMQTDHIDLMVVDASLGEQHFEQLVAHSLAFCPRPKILAIAHTKIQQQAYAAHVDAVLLRGFSTDRLHDTVYHLLENFKVSAIIA